VNYSKGIEQNSEEKTFEVDSISVDVSLGHHLGDVVVGQRDAEPSERRLEFGAVDVAVLVLVERVEHLADLHVLRQRALVVIHEQQKLAEIDLSITCITNQSIIIF